MTVTGMSDLSRSNRLVGQVAAARTDLDRAARELATGRSAQIAAQADPVRLFAFERAHEAARARATDLALAGGLAESMLATVVDLSDLMDGLDLRLIDAAARADGRSLGALMAEAAGSFDTLIQRLNGSYGGRMLFGGAATDAPPLPPSEAILDRVRLEVAGIDDPDILADAVTAFFLMPDGGFAAEVYGGSDLGLPAIDLGDGRRALLPARADDPAFRSLMAGLAMAALANEPGSPLGGAERFALARRAAQEITVGLAGTAALRDGLGLATARIDAARTEAVAETAMLEAAVAERWAVDPYETASRVRALETQLETLYTVTARLAALRLVSFLR